MKRNLFISILLISVLMIAASVVMAADTETITCENPLPQPRVIDGTPFVGFMWTQMAAESTQRIRHFTHLEMERRGWEFMEITDCIDANVQRDAVQTFINRDVDAMFLVFPVMEKFKDLVLEAREKGIGVYCIDTELRPGVIVNTTQSNGVAGCQMTYYGVNNLNMQGEVLYITNTWHFGVRQRTYASRGLIVNEWPLLEMVGYENIPSSGWEKASFDIAQNYISRYGEELDWVFGGWDTPAIIASRAVEQQGFSGDDIFCTGIDGGSEAWGEIRKGSPFEACVSQPFEEYSYSAFNIFEEIQVDGIGIGTEESTLPDSRTIFHESVVTTKDSLPPVGVNVHQFFTKTYYDESAPDDAWFKFGDQYMVE